MSYIRAEEVLPKELIEAIQQYISGENIYITCVEKKDWGSQTDTKKYYKDRNKAERSCRYLTVRYELYSSR